MLAVFLCYSSCAITAVMKVVSYDEFIAEQFSSLEALRLEVIGVMLTSWMASWIFELTNQDK